MKFYVFLAFTAISCQQIDIPLERERGIKQFESDSLVEAIKTFAKIIKATDTCSSCFLYRGFSYKGLGNFDEAIRDFDSFIQLGTSQALGYANKASIYYLQKDYKRSLINFQKALSLEPENKALFNPISHMLYATGKKDSACIYFQKSNAVGDTIFDRKITEYCRQNGYL